MYADNPQHIWILIARKLSGEATAAELQELEELLRNNPQINYSKELLNDLWAAAPAVDNKYGESRFKELVLQMQHMGIDEGKFTDGNHYINEAGNDVHHKRFSRKKILVFSALMSIVLFSVAIFYSYTKKEETLLADMPSRNEIATKNGSKTSLRLPDGTKVWLNAGSELTYEKNYGTKLREVTLKGEAYFDVVKNANKAFIIHTAAMDIKVLGTAFNVKCYPGDRTTETSLVRGSLEVTLKDRQEKIMLKPNEKLVINLDDEKTAAKQPASAAPSIQEPMISLSHLTVYPGDSSVIETAWLQNKLIFSSETFEDIALKMERWYAVKINFSNEAIKTTRFTGTIERESIKEALNAMQFSLQNCFSYSIKNDTITIAKFDKTKKIMKVIYNTS